MFDRSRQATDFYNDGARCLRMGQFAEAITMLQISISLNPEKPDAFAALCLAAHEDSQHDLLYASVMRLFDLPDRAAVQRGTAVNYYDSGFYLEAVTCALESLTIRPDEALGNYILGRSYLALNMFAEAERVLGRALELAPDFKVVESHLTWLKTYLSIPECERIPLLETDRSVPMHQHPLDIREMEKYPFAADSLKDLFGK
ncbi:MAG TPA: tetratricopeptide repeat protein [Pyrinomonadaceae bacterium]|nr:tetratricopeptide repeat protein [Pyrinomonadaceae bacterium]